MVPVHMASESPLESEGTHIKLETKKQNKILSKFMLHAKYTGYAQQKLAIPPPPIIIIIKNK